MADVECTGNGSSGVCIMIDECEYAFKKCLTTLLTMRKIR